MKSLFDLNPLLVSSKNPVLGSASRQLSEILNFAYEFSRLLNFDQLALFKVGNDHVVDFELLHFQNLKSAQSFRSRSRLFQQSDHLLLFMIDEFEAEEESLSGGKLHVCVNRFGK